MAEVSFTFSSDAYSGNNPFTVVSFSAYQALSRLYRYEIRIKAPTSTQIVLDDLLDEPAVRVLMYVWGGTHKAGSVLPTPYLGERGRTIVLRPAQTGEASEQVNLAADHLAAFGEEAAVLVGLAVSADSDDTNSGIDASIRGLRLLP